MVPYTLGSLIAAMTVGKLGSDLNHLLEPTAALAVWAGVATQWRPKRLAIGRQAIPLLMLCQLVWMIIASQPLRLGMATRWRNIADYDQMYAYVQAAVAQGPVLADDQGSMVVLAGQRLYIEPFATCQQLRAAGLWDPSDMLDRIKEREFPMILVASPGSALAVERWSESVLSAIDENYQVFRVLQKVAIYVPHGTDTSRSVTGAWSMGLLDNRRYPGANLTWVSMRRAAPAEERGDEDNVGVIVQRRGHP